MKTPLEIALQRQLRLPNLTAEEENTLARTVRAWLDAEDPSPAVVRAGKRARDTLVTRNLRLAAQFCMRRRCLWAHTPLDFSDVMTYACVGLQVAAEKHNTNGAYRFSTYATWWIRCHVTRGIQAERYLIRIPGSVQNAMSRVRKGQEEPDHLVHAAEAVSNCASLDALYTLDHDGEATFDPPAPPPPPEADEATLERIWNAAGPNNLKVLEAAFEGSRTTTAERKRLRLALSTLGESPQQILQAA